MTLWIVVSALLLGWLLPCFWLAWRDDNCMHCDACDRRRYLRWDHETTAWLCRACWLRIVNGERS